jgi:hypothetical protein
MKTPSNFEGNIPVVPPVSKKNNPRASSKLICSSTYT